MGSKSFIFFVGAVLFVSNLNAQTLFYKDDDAFQKTEELQFIWQKDWNLEVKSDSFLKRFNPDYQSLEKTFLEPVSDKEALRKFDTMAASMTALFMMPISHVYELSPDFVLFRQEGVIFFIFPYEVQNLYRRCGDKLYRIATMRMPKEIKEREKLFAELKSPAELDELCKSGDDQEKDTLSSYEDS